MTASQSCFRQVGMVPPPSPPRIPGLAILILAAALLTAVAARAAGDPAGTAEQPAGDPGQAVAPPADPESGTDPDPTALRIRYLHGRLRVTPAQEAAWGKVAQVLWDNARVMTPLLREKLRTTREGSAPDILATSQRVDQARLAGLGRFADAFRPFYAMLSGSQKKTADVLLRQAPLDAMVSGIPQAALPPVSITTAPPLVVPRLPLPPPPLGSANPVYPTSPSYPIFTPTYPPAVWPLTRPPLGGGLVGPPVILPPLGQFGHPHRFHHPGDPHPFRPGQIYR